MHGLGTNALLFFTGCAAISLDPPKLHYVHADQLIELFCLNQKCHVKKKDIRKFLEGDKGAIKKE
jgi:hypothetical protein